MTTTIKYSTLFSAALLLAPAVRGAEPAAAPGIFLSKSGAGGDSVRVPGQVVTRMRQTGMLKVMLTGGHAQGNLVGTIDGAKSPVRAASGRVSFRFQLNSRSDASARTDMPGGDMMSMMSGDYMPPKARQADQFILVRLRPTGDAREASFGSPNGRNSSIKDAIPFTSEPLGTTAFRVTPKEPLAPGEYAFMFRSEGGGGQLWDFGVDGN